MEKLSQDIVACLKAMHEEATTVRNGLRTGLVDYAGHKGIGHAPWEVPIYRALGEHLAALGYSVESDIRYSNASRQECDLLIRRGTELACWTELKLVRKDWISTESGGRKTGGVDSYTTGGSGRSHSLAQDFEKLEQVAEFQGSHVRVVAIAFDAVGNTMDGLIEGVERAQHLKAKAWQRDLLQVVPDHNSAAHRICLWSWSKTVGTPEHLAGQSSKALCSPADVLGWIDDFPAFEARAELSLKRYLALDSTQWLWEDWVAECLQISTSDLLVVSLGEIVRQAEAPFNRNKYHDAARLERVIVTLHDQAVRALRRMADSRVEGQ